jgi:hypothetical protein
VEGLESDNFFSLFDAVEPIGSLEEGAFVRVGQFNQFI